MEGILDYRLFRVGDTPVTVASLAVSLVILLGSYLLARLARKLVAQRLLARTHLSVGVRYVLGRFTGYLILFFGVAMALQTVGIHATTLAAFGAAVGVGIGFGLQDVVRNFVAGLILLIERPFQVGDRIEIDKTNAEVVEVRARATVLRTNDDVHLIVPNAKFITETVVNRTYGRPLYRLRTAVPVSYESDPAEVKDALFEAARRCEGALPDPAPAVRFRSFDASTMRFELLCWTNKMIHRPGALVSELNLRVHEVFRERGIPLPSSRLDVNVHETPAEEAPSEPDPAARRARELQASATEPSFARR
jgi:small-conductance mechanosensitive channel